MALKPATTAHTPAFNCIVKRYASQAVAASKTNLADGLKNDIYVRSLSVVESLQNSLLTASVERGKAIKSRSLARLCDGETG